ncbi:MAG: hypothetical protein IPN69_22090 [Acidobacteria bacterium]|nr:hypothetical protein [Acidobacteriota bacterium]
MTLRLIALILILAATGGATTIVAVKTKKEIVIGADSKVTDTFGNTKAKFACKIISAGGVVFAYAGFARDTQTGFDVPEIVAGSLEQNSKKPIAEKVEILAATIVERLNVELPLLKQNSFVTYREKIEGRTFLRILVAGFEKKKPVLLVRQFRIGQIADGSIGVIVSKNDCDAKCKGTNVTRFLGETEAIDGLPEETKDFWNQGLAAGVRKLVEIQIAAREEYVGPPIDVVSITSKGLTWIARKSECGVGK